MAHPEILIYHYTFSPYARRILWYLALRQLPYTQCLQPSLLPRPDIAALGLAHRRIPIVAIGQDVYLDTRLILAKLEAIYPSGALGAQELGQRAVQELLGRWVIDGGLFSKGAGLIPLDLPNMNDERWLRDREDYSGRPWDKEKMRQARPENEVAVRDAFLLLEGLVLGDGRSWVLGGKRASLADIEAVWLFDWLMGMKGALPDTISDKTFPHVFAWVKRFKAAWKAGQAQTKTVTVKGDEAAKQIFNAKYSEELAEVDPTDPLGLQKGAEVEIWPTDSGASHHDRGRLLALTPEEVVIEVKVKDTDHTIRIHAPRRGFRIARVRDEKL